MTTSSSSSSSVAAEVFAGDEGTIPVFPWELPGGVMVREPGEAVVLLV